MKIIKMTHYSDAGHGWFAVKRSVLVQLGLQANISAYSYQSKTGSTVYLEEDGDASILVNALKAHNIPYQIQSKDNRGLSPIRSYPQFKAVSV